MPPGQNCCPGYRALVTTPGQPKKTIQVRPQPEQPLSAFGWSSYPPYLAGPSRRPSWLRVDRLLGEWGIPKDSVAGRRVFGERMEWRRGEALRGEFKRVERGWCLGGEEFRQELLAQVSELDGPEHRGEDICQSAHQKAEQIVGEELGKLGWGVEDLAGRPRWDARKVRIAARLRGETTMTLAGIAERLHMSAAGHVSCLLYRERHSQKQAQDENSENKWFWPPAGRPDSSHDRSRQNILNAHLPSHGPTLMQLSLPGQQNNTISRVTSLGAAPDKSQLQEAESSCKVNSAC